MPQQAVDEPEDLDTIPEPPWLRRRGARPAPRQPLTREVIVEAALRVLDADGFDALSMRRVAEETGAGAASLYGHVGNKEQLLQLVWDKVIGEVELPPPDPAHWQEQVKEFAHAWRTVLRRHRGVARISLGRIPTGPNALRAMEWSLGLLRAAGLPDRTAAFAGDLMALYVDAHSYEESLELGSPAGSGAPPEQFVAMMRDYFASLPPARFPNIVALSGVMFEGDADERFEFGLDLVVRGLATQVSVE